MKIEIAPVIDLLHRAEHSTLATNSALMPGYPYATAVPNILDERHRPILLLSALAEHTKNVMADGRVSLSITEPGVTNVQDGQRLTIVGDTERFAAAPEMKARYLRYLPDAERYLQLDFVFFRIIPKNIRYIGGVGKMGWVQPESLGSPPSLSLHEEAELLAVADELVPSNIQILGIDCFGIDYLADGFRDRVSLESGDLRSQLETKAPKLT